MADGVLENKASDTGWYYSVDGTRVGPLPEWQIRELIGTKRIAETSMVWNRSLPDWQPILSSVFGPVFGETKGPPPLAVRGVNNTLVWILAFAPFLGYVVQAILGEVFRQLYDVLFLAPMVLNIALAYSDEMRLKRAGHDTAKMGAAWLIPVYLFKRAKVLNQTSWYFVVWCVVFGLTIVGILNGM